MLQLLALLACALVALVCVLALAAAPDWFRSPPWRVIARAFAGLVLACTCICALIFWCDWSPKDVMARNDLTVSRSERRDEIRKMLIRTMDKDPTDADVERLLEAQDQWRREGLVK